MARVNVVSPQSIQNSTYTYQADSAVSDSYAIALTPPITAYATGQSFLFKATTANTGAASLNVNSLGAKTIKKNNDQDLATGDIEAGQIVGVVYDGTNFQMQSTSATTTSDHGSLGGLTDDDHTQYLLAAGSRALTADWNAGNFKQTLGSFEYNNAGGYAAQQTADGGDLPLGAGNATTTDGNGGNVVLRGGAKDGAGADGVVGIEDPTSTNVWKVDVSALTDDRVVTAPDTAGAIVIDSATQTLSNKTLSGAIPLEENASIDHDPVLSADGKYTGTDCITGIAGATLAFGDLVYPDPTDSRWELADANSAAAADGDARGLLGICVLAAANDGDATKILLKGVVRADTAFPALTLNAPLYVSETAGDITHTAPTTTDAVQRVVGYAIPDGGTSQSIYFNPESSYQTAV